MWTGVKRRKRRMIDRLRFVKNNTENPKLLEIIGKMGQLSEEAQERLCDCIEQGVFSLKGEKQRQK